MNQSLSTCTSYKITTNTLALVPQIIPQNCTLILEKNQSILINQSIAHILSENCESDGSTLIRRKKLMQFCMNNAVKKIPVVVNVKEELVMIPTTSTTSSDCIWISMKRVRKCYPIQNQKKTLVLFKCNENTIVSCSLKQFNVNMQRAVTAFSKFIKHSGHH